MEDKQLKSTQTTKEKKYFQKYFICLLEFAKKLQFISSVRSHDNDTVYDTQGRNNSIYIDIYAYT